MATIETDQAIEIPLSQYTRNGIHIRYTCQRKRESVQNSRRSEDYLAFDAEPSHVSFALCDGVSSSFFGNLASQILAEYLVTWLSSEVKPDKTVDVLVQQLNTDLNNNTNFAQSLVEAKKTPWDDHDIYRKAIQEKRKRGTESNFVCGYMQSASPSYPKGRVLLFWLGDAKLRVYQDYRNVSNDFQIKSGVDGEYWSSARGVLGPIYHCEADLNQIDTVIAHSDGLDPNAVRLRPQISDAQLQQYIESAQDYKDDDVSYIEITVDPNITVSEDELVHVLRHQFNTPQGDDGASTEETEIPEEPASVFEEQPQKCVSPFYLFIVSMLFLIMGCCGGYSLNTLWQRTFDTSSDIVEVSETTELSPTRKPTRTATFTPEPIDTPTLSPTPIITVTPFWETETPMPTLTATSMITFTPEAAVETPTATLTLEVDTEPESSPTATLKETVAPEAPEVTDTPEAVEEIPTPTQTIEQGGNDDA